MWSAVPPCICLMVHQIPCEVTQGDGPLQAFSGCLLFPQDVNSTGKVDPGSRLPQGVLWAGTFTSACGDEGSHMWTQQHSLWRVYPIRVALDISKVKTLKMGMDVYL